MLEDLLGLVGELLEVSLVDDDSGELIELLDGELLDCEVLDCALLDCADEPLETEALSEPELHAVTLTSRPAAANAITGRVESRMKSPWLSLFACEPTKVDGVDP